MATTIVTKYGSDAPAASDLVRGELAVDTENGRLYTENSSGAVVEIGLNPEGNVDVTGSVTADGLTVANTSVIAGDFDGGTAATYIRLQDDTDNFLFGSNNSLGNFLIKNETADALRLSVANTGDISFYEDTGTTAKLFWDASAESLGIGTSSPATGIDVTSTNYTYSGTTYDIYGIIGLTSGGVRLGGDSSNSDSVIGTTGTGNMQFVTYNGSAWGSRMTLDNTGNVGIGTDSPTMPLSVKAASNAYAINMHGRSDGYSELYGSSSDGSTKYAFLQTHSTQTKLYTLVNTPLLFGTNSTEAMRISGGNLLVGKSSSSFGTDGFQVNADGQIWATNASASVTAFNRRTTDGAISVYYKDGTAVGSIGSISGDLFIAESTSGLRFDGENNQILPSSTTASTDGTCNLGAGTARFKDFYLSGGAYLGGTAAANKLDDYEEGTWTPQVNFGSSDNGVTYSTRTGRYTKIGRMVYLSFNILLSSKGSQTGQVTISGAPFGNYTGSQSNASPIICEGNGSSFPDAFGMMWNDNQIYVRYQGATSKLPVYESNFTNSTQIFGMMKYET